MTNEALIKLLVELLTERTSSAAKSDDTKSDDAGNDLFSVGKQYFIRTVTYHMVGVCTAVKHGFVFLDKSMWVADAGRLGNSLKEGIEKQSESELEPYHGIVHISINSIVDFVEYIPKINVMQK